MAYGFSATNNGGDIIISDQTETLHFIGKAVLDQSKTEYDLFTSFDPVGYDGVLFNTPEGHTEFTYTIETTGIPLAFIKPTDHERFHAIVSQSNDGDLWTFIVIVGGDLTGSNTSVSSATAPNLYIFVDAANTVVENPDERGLLVLRSDGERAFDSRVPPLTIESTGRGIAPTLPTATEPTVTDGHPWNYNILDVSFRSSESNSYEITPFKNIEDLMFAVPSVAQCAYRRQVEGFKSSKGFFSSQDHFSTAQWWGMWRQGFRLRHDGTNNLLDYGWATWAVGYSFSSYAEASFWIWGGGSWASGSIPFTPKTINNVETTYIIADATRYE